LCLFVFIGNKLNQASNVKKSKRRLKEKKQGNRRQVIVEFVTAIRQLQEQLAKVVDDLAVTRPIGYWQWRQLVVSSLTGVTDS